MEKSIWLTRDGLVERWKGYRILTRVYILHHSKPTWEDKYGWSSVHYSVISKETACSLYPPSRRWKGCSCSCKKLEVVR